MPWGTVPFYFKHSFSSAMSEFCISQSKILEMLIFSQLLDNKSSLKNNVNHPSNLNTTVSLLPSICTCPQIEYHSSVLWLLFIDKTCKSISLFMDKCNLLVINLFNSSLYLLLFSFKNRTCHIFPNKDRAVKCKM